MLMADADGKGVVVGVVGASDALLRQTALGLLEAEARVAANLCS